MKLKHNTALDSFMEIELKTKIIAPEKKIHPSKIERNKLEEARKKRLTQALRDNLRKRKDQVRGRNQD